MKCAMEFLNFDMDCSLEDLERHGIEGAATIAFDIAQESNDFYYVPRSEFVAAFKKLAEEAACESQ